MANLEAFHELVKKGDLAGVRAGLESDRALLDAPNATGQTAFLLAHYYRQPAVAEYLLSQEPQLDVFTNCVAGRIEAVLGEVDRDPELLAQHSSDGWTPLHLAAFFGHPELAKGLLNRGAAVDTRSTNAMQNTPLHAAVAGGKADLVALLLDAGADVNARQHGGWTALHGAAQSGSVALALVLLEHRADGSLRADNNQSALDLALLQGKGDVAALLEQYGSKLA